VSRHLFNLSSNEIIPESGFTYLVFRLWMNICFEIKSPAVKRQFKNIYRPFATKVSQLKMCDFSGQNFIKDLMCYNFLWVQRRHNCSPAASFANCVMTLYLLKVHLQTFLSIPITQKCLILSCDTLVANERYVLML